MRDVGNDRLDLDLGIDAPQLVRGRDRLRQSVGHVLLIVQHLPLQVVEFEKIAIHDPHESDARAHECFGDDRTQRTASAHKRASLTQAVAGLLRPAEQSGPGDRIEMLTLYRS